MLDGEMQCNPADDQLNGQLPALLSSLTPYPTTPTPLQDELKVSVLFFVFTTLVGEVLNLPISVVSETPLDPPPPSHASSLPHNIPSDVMTPFFMHSSADMCHVNHGRYMNEKTSIRIAI